MEASFLEAPDCCNHIQALLSVQKSFGFCSWSQCCNEISCLILEGKTFINQNINTKNWLVRSIRIPAVVSKLSVLAVWKHFNIYHYFRVFLLAFISFPHNGGKMVLNHSLHFHIIPQVFSSATFFFECYCNEKQVLCLYSNQCEREEAASTIIVCKKAGKCYSPVVSFFWVSNDAVVKSGKAK